jgi:hypothetical protein
MQDNKETGGTFTTVENQLATFKHDDLKFLTQAIDSLG